MEFALLYISNKTPNKIIELQSISLSLDQFKKYFYNSPINSFHIPNDVRSKDIFKLDKLISSTGNKVNLLNEFINLNNRILSPVDKLQLQQDLDLQTTLFGKMKYQNVKPYKQIKQNILDNKFHFLYTEEFKSDVLNLIIHIQLPINIFTTESISLKKKETKQIKNVFQEQVIMRKNSNKTEHYSDFDLEAYFEKELKW